METETVLKFKEMMQKHFDMELTLKAKNSIGENSTEIMFVDDGKPYVHGGRRKS